MGEIALKQSQELTTKAQPLKANMYDVMCDVAYIEDQSIIVNGEEKQCSRMHKIMDVLVRGVVEYGEQDVDENGDPIGGYEESINMPYLRALIDIGRIQSAKEVKKEESNKDKALLLLVQKQLEEKKKNIIARAEVIDD